MLIIVGNYSDKQAVCNAACMDNNMYSNARSTRAMYRESSYGLLDFDTSTAVPRVSSNLIVYFNKCIHLCFFATDCHGGGTPNSRRSLRVSVELTANRRGDERTSFSSSKCPIVELRHFCLFHTSVLWDWCRLCWGNSKLCQRC